MACETSIGRQPGAGTRLPFSNSQGDHSIPRVTSNHSDGGRNFVARWTKQNRANADTRAIGSVTGAYDGEARHIL